MRWKILALAAGEDLLIDFTLNEVSASLGVEFDEKIVDSTNTETWALLSKTLSTKPFKKHDFVFSHITYVLDCVGLCRSILGEMKGESYAEKNSLSDFMGCSNS